MVVQRYRAAEFDPQGHQPAVRFVEREEEQPILLIPIAAPLVVFVVGHNLHNERQEKPQKCGQQRMMRWAQWHPSDRTNWQLFAECTAALFLPKTFSRSTIHFQILEKAERMA